MCEFVDAVVCFFLRGCVGGWFDGRGGGFGMQRRMYEYHECPGFLCPGFCDLPVFLFLSVCVCPGFACSGDFRCAIFNVISVEVIDLEIRRW